MSALGSAVQQPPDDWQVRLRELCGTRYPRLADAVLEAFERWPLSPAGGVRPPAGGARPPADSDTRVKRLLRALSVSKGLERALSAPLTFVRQHTALLRHDLTRFGFCDKRLATVAHGLADLVVYFRGLDGKYPTARCALEAADFYYEYYVHVAPRADLRPLEDFRGFWPTLAGPLSSEPGPLSSEPGPLSSEPGQQELPRAWPAGPETPSFPGVLYGPETRPPGESLSPPQGQTIAWYKANGWREFLREKTLVFLSGKLEGVPLRVKRYNGNNTVFVDTAGKSHLVSHEHKAQWS